MVGNKSTGMRTRLVTPMTRMTRHTTMMKYGLRIEKRDIYAHLAAELSNTALLLIALVILHDLHHLRMNLLSRFQCAAIANDYLFSFS